MLWRRKRVARVLKRQALDADVGQTPLLRREGLLARGHLDQRLRRIARRAQVEHIALVLHPEAALRRAADLLHDRPTARAPWQTIARRPRRLQRWGKQLAILLHRLQRFAVYKDESTAP